MPEQGTKLP